MTSTICWRKQELVVQTPASVKEALESLHLDTESFLVIRNGELIGENEILQDGDSVKLIPVMIGG